MVIGPQEVSRNDWIFSRDGLFELSFVNRIRPLLLPRLSRAR